MIGLGRVAGAYLTKRSLCRVGDDPTRVKEALSGIEQITRPYVTVPTLEKIFSICLCIPASVKQIDVLKTVAR